MTWQPGSPVETASDHAEWQLWRKAQRLEQQRRRRRRRPRIDYIPSEEALAVIQAKLREHAGESFGRAIDRLVLSAVRELPDCKYRQ